VKDPVDARRARHILTENQRVLDVVAALADSDFEEVGRIFTTSHASMRDDFEITTDHIDLIADTAVRAGALGARMTGGGFGGCVVNLVEADAAELDIEAASDAPRTKTRTHRAERLRNIAACPAEFPPPRVPKSYRRKSFSL